MTDRSSVRRLPFGAEVVDEGVSFRLWAPQSNRAAVVLGATKERIPMRREPTGCFHAIARNARPGSRYLFELDNERQGRPDPASRFQPEGPHGPSEVVDHRKFPWTDQTWRGPPSTGQIVYELHVGTFTPEGTWHATRQHLSHLADLGVTLLEVMPVAEFSGRFGWGYDGVDLFAPSRLYGRPDDFRKFVDDAHAHGLGVILDVVYNHFGPDGNYLPLFSPHYLTDRHAIEWGDAINFDDEQAGPVREFYRSNAAYWIEEFHLDGLRLDATQSIHDQSPRHILAEVTAAAREAARGRKLWIVAENEPQDVRHILAQDDGGFGIDALWNDDFHHAARVALTGRAEAYYSDYRGTPQEFISAVKRGFLFQGQWHQWQKQPRGTPALGFLPAQFVTFLENHDQVANSAHGMRLHELTSPGRYRAITALFLLAPQTPMLFQGQEFASSRPFRYFADHERDLADRVAQGRREFLSQFPSLASPQARQAFPDPADRSTFEQCRLDWSECDQHPEALTLHRDLIRLRRTDPVISRQSGEVDGAVLSQAAFVLRFFSDGDERLLLVNLGVDLRLSPMPEPLLAPPRGRAWELTWSSESPAYGGAGMPAWRWNETCTLPGESAVLMSAREADRHE
jgi:maltooligosyltrehalose trehalohydrolase